MALDAPRRDLSRREKAPRAERQWEGLWAGTRRAAAARFAQGFVRPLSRLPPEILLPGHSPSQDAKCFSDGQRVMSRPISPRIVRAVVSAIPSMRVRSTPVTR